MLMRFITDQAEANRLKAADVSLIPVMSIDPDGLPTVTHRTQTRPERRAATKRAKKKNRRAGPPTVKKH